MALAGITFGIGRVHHLVREERMRLVELIMKGGGRLATLSRGASGAGAGAGAGAAARDIVYAHYSESPETVQGGMTDRQKDEYAQLRREPSVWTLDALEAAVGAPLGSLAPRLRWISTRGWSPTSRLADAAAAASASSNPLLAAVAAADATGGSKPVSPSSIFSFPCLSTESSAGSSPVIHLADALQLTDLMANSNKFYVLEVVEVPGSGSGSGGGGESRFFVLTHYGRTVAGVAEGGRKDAREADDLDHAVAMYCSIYRAKTKKGYAPVHLQSSSLGSPHLQALAAEEHAVMTSLEWRGKAGRSPATSNRPARPHPAASNAPVGAAQPPAHNDQSRELDPILANFVEEIYGCALQTLTSSVPMVVNERGLVTPLGVLSLPQVQRGFQALEKIRDALEADAPRQVLTQLSSEFYMAVPHNLDRSGITAAVVDSPAKLAAKVRLVQLMLDVVSVAGSGPGAQVFVSGSTHDKLAALNASISVVPPDSPEYRKLARHVLITDIKELGISIKNIFAVQRPGEPDDAALSALNAASGARAADLPPRRLFHGSRASNWVGLLSRGILLPKLVVARGMARTDAGALGAGVYFGADASTAAQYCADVDGSGSSSRFMAVAAVATGKEALFTAPNPSLAAPPPGYDSVHGARICPDTDLPTQFADDEHVVYDQSRYAVRYVVEFTANVDDAARAAAAKAAAQAAAAGQSPAFVSVSSANAATGGVHDMLDTTKGGVIEGPRFTPPIYPVGSAASLGFAPAERPTPGGVCLGIGLAPPPVATPMQVIMSTLLSALARWTRQGIITKQARGRVKDVILADSLSSASSIITRLTSLATLPDHRTDAQAIRFAVDQVASA